MIRLQFELLGRNITVKVQDAQVSLWLDGCVRKQRDVGVTEPVYLWTNVELMWEEHRLIEVFYWHGIDHLRISINGQDIHALPEVRIHPRGVKPDNECPIFSG